LAALLHLGSTELATEHLTLAVEAGRAQNDPRLQGSSHTHLSSVAYQSGQYSAAEREARQALELLTSAPPLKAIALSALARALLALERTLEAADSAERAMAVLESLGGIEGAESFVRLVYAEVQEGLGDRTAARRAIAQARDRLQARAARIVDAALRHSFLNVHPDNAGTMALARLLGEG
jgi:eukaryotic-like serine/threonine-protein kinase